MTHRVRQAMTLLLFPLFISLASGCATGKRIERMSDGKEVGFNEMMADIKGSRLIFIGELHDNRDHHRLQLDAIKWLKAAGVDLALGVEMFSYQDQPELDRWVSGQSDLLAFVAVYQENWSIPWSLYDSIFLFARNNVIPVIGINAPKGLVQKVFRQGFASLSHNERMALPPGITCGTDAQYRKFIKDIYFDHGNSEEGFDRFCEAQALRNRTMGRILADYLKRNPKKTVIVLTGVGHAMKRGAPQEMSRNPETAPKVIIPAMGDTALEYVNSGDADYFVRSYGDEP